MQGNGKNRRSKWLKPMPWGGDLAIAFDGYVNTSTFFAFLFSTGPLREKQKKEKAMVQAFLSLANTRGKGSTVYLDMVYN